MWLCIFSVSAFEFFYGAFNPLPIVVCFLWLWHCFLFLLFARMRSYKLKWILYFVIHWLFKVRIVNLYTAVTHKIKIQQNKNRFWRSQMVHIHSMNTHTHTHMSMIKNSMPIFILCTHKIREHEFYSREFCPPIHFFSRERIQSLNANKICK